MNIDSHEFQLKRPAEELGAEEVPPAAIALYLEELNFLPSEMASFQL